MSILKTVLGGTLSSDPFGRPMPADRRQWPFALTLAVLALGFLISWLAIAKMQGENSLSKVQSEAANQRVALSQLLTRFGESPTGVDLSAVLATPRYLRLIGQEQLLQQYAPNGEVLFFLSEDTHIEETLPKLPPLALRVNGMDYAPIAIHSIADSFHHRVSVLAFPGTGTDGRSLLDAANKTLDLHFVSGAQAISSMQWDLPIAYPQDSSLNQPLTIGLVLALFSGLLASMWPCLFQLTAYFIPTVAGLSMEQIEGQGVGVTARVRVIKTAFFFVLGFTIVYTLIGALAGYTGSSLGNTGWIDSLRQPLSIIAGGGIIAMAIRVAANARAPFVCHMPIFWGSRRGTGPLGTMLMGLVFASGCMTCFGAAVLIGLLAYVGTAGSVLMGAGLLFLFSLGIGIPLVIAAVAMARILPLLGRLERVAPYLALASSLVMIVFGVLMITNHLHSVSSLVYRGLPGF